MVGDCPQFVHPSAREVHVLISLVIASPVLLASRTDVAIQKRGHCQSGRHWRGCHGTREQRARRRNQRECGQSFNGEE